MKRIAVIGAGISGMTVAHHLQCKYDVTIYEKEHTPGGLIRCSRVDGCLFHQCGGHVFNSKRKDVLDWFWSHFDQQKEFIKADRNSVVYMPDGQIIPYPIENHVYMMSEQVQNGFIKDMLYLSHLSCSEFHNFEDFLQNRFGNTLYNLYFKPYNEKIWKRELHDVPMGWLEGKLPMPTVEEMIYNNFNHIDEKTFVHSSFWYEKKNGSQFIADRLSEGLDIRHDSEVKAINRKGSSWEINGERYDIVVFCGNVKDLPSMLSDIELGSFVTEINNLTYHGTTSVLCEVAPNPYSWVYQPDTSHLSHRIICTGNFSPTNNVDGKMTGIVEFTDEMNVWQIKENLSRMPLCPKYMAHHYSKCTYPIQDSHTKGLIKSLKSTLQKYELYLTGRFAEWEYYNMDVAMGAAMDLCKTI